MPDQRAEDDEVRSCRLGHTQRSMECPGCAEANGTETSVEWWRWYKGRTSSRTVKDAVTAHLAVLRG